MVVVTHPYRVPLREGDPLYPPLSERLPVQGLAGCTNEKCNLWRLRLMKEHNRLAWAAARHLAAPTHKNRFGGEPLSAPERIVYLPRPEDYPGWGPWMRFRLTYEGELRATGRDPENGQPEPLAAHKQRIRKEFHGELKRLWETNRFLKEHEVPEDGIHVRPGGVVSVRGATMLDLAPKKMVPLPDHISANFHRDGYRFVPLVCEDFSLLCSLDILFLRRDFRAGVIHAGDLDNRVKTLIDTLRMPKGANELKGHETPAAGEDPFFCLLEDDNLVTALSVESGMLLDPPVAGDGGDSRVKLVVSVELKPDDVTMFNLGFA
jgi:hypothetical protein